MYNPSSRYRSTFSSSIGYPSALCGSGYRGNIYGSAGIRRSDYDIGLPPPRPPSYTSPYLSDTSCRATGRSKTSSFASLPRNCLNSGPPYKRSISASPSRADKVFLSDVLSPVRSLIKDSFSDDSPSSTSSIVGSGRGLNGGNHSRLKSPSVPRERTRDELIDSIIFTRTRENRVMPGFKSASDWEERRSIKIDCDEVFKGIILANGETVKDMLYLKSIGVTHVLNTAEMHVRVNPAHFPLNGISYYGFHVDDHPSANISRYFTRCTEFIDEAVKSGGLVVVNCAMGWSRSATVVAAYLMMKFGMTSSRALETIRQSRPIRPNPGFLQQLADYENMLNKKLVWI